MRLVPALDSILLDCPRVGCQVASTYRFTLTETSILDQPIDKPIDLNMHLATINFRLLKPNPVQHQPFSRAYDHLTPTLGSA